MSNVNHLLKVIIVLSLFFLNVTGLFATESLLAKGIGELKSKKPEEAVRIFSAILANDELSNLHSDALYWLVKTKIGLKDYVNASVLIDKFLSRYTTDKRLFEMKYHKARLYYLTGDPEKALAELGKFIDITPGGGLYVSALYWTGESLMSLGRLKEAKKVFFHIVNKYKDSIKYAVSEYRLREIGYLEREQVLLDLIRWSYEAHMQDLESFQKQINAIYNTEDDETSTASELDNQDTDKAEMIKDELRIRIEKARQQLKNMKITTEIREQLLLDKENYEKIMETP